MLNLLLQYGFNVNLVDITRKCTPKYNVKLPPSIVEILLLNRTQITIKTINEYSHYCELTNQEHHKLCELAQYVRAREHIYLGIHTQLRISAQNFKRRPDSIRMQLYFMRIDIDNGVNANNISIKYPDVYRYLSLPLNYT